MRRSVPKRHGGGHYGYTITGIAFLPRFAVGLVTFIDGAFLADGVLSVVVVALGLHSSPENNHLIFRYPIILIQLQLALPQLDKRED